MTRKKQTAVEALIKALENDGLELFGMDKFLELEKQQIIDAWAHGVFAKNSDTAEQYYSETYGGGNEQQ